LIITPETSLKQLYEILVGLHDPQSLDEHPWANRAFVRSVVKTTAGMNVLSPGWQLSLALLQVFRKSMPSHPPRTGKRLDTHWGVFGLMAARYFFPFIQNQPPPENLPAAWGNIDSAILYFVSEKEGKELSPKLLESYHLLAGETSPAPYSTLSDWHRKGLEILLSFIEHAEAIPQGKQTNTPHAIRWPRVPFKLVFALIGLVLSVALVVMGYRCWSLYQQARTLQAQAKDLQGFLKADLSLENVPEISTRVSELRQGLDSFTAEASPWLPLAAYLDWLPEYGGVLAQSAELLDLGKSLVSAGDEALQVAAPLLSKVLPRMPPPPAY